MEKGFELCKKCKHILKVDHNDTRRLVCPYCGWSKAYLTIDELYRERGL